MTDEDNTTEVEQNSTENDATQEQQSEQENFSAEYVRGLRDESAQRRVEAREQSERADAMAEALRSLAIRHYAADLLADPADLPWTDEMAGEDGLPDADAIRAAAGELVSRKPHFGRPSGDIGQGFRDESSEGVDLAALMRAGA